MKDAERDDAGERAPPVTPARQGAAPPPRRAQIDALLPAIQRELRAIAQNALKAERANHTLQATALVNEAYLRLIQQRDLDPADRPRFFAAAASTFRRILVDYARARAAHKRGGGQEGRGTERITLSDVQVADEGLSALDVIALDDALAALARTSERVARGVELRFFGGLTVKETAAALNISTRAAEDDWAFARAWLRRQLQDGGRDA